MKTTGMRDQIARDLVSGTSAAGTLFTAFLLCAGASAQVANDGSLGSNGAGVVANTPVGAGTHYFLREGDGQLVGGRNLFFSLLQMDLGADDAAIYQGRASIENLITRITGGPSTIDGLIRSEIDGANVFLVNPDGIVFGENASLDVSGAFVVSTADEVALGQTGRFDAHGAGGDVLTVDAPERFGFLAPPAPIIVAGSRFEGTDQSRIALIGGDLTLSGQRAGSDPGLLSVRSGRIDLVSVASSGGVQIAANSAPVLVVDEGTTRGNIEIRDDMRISSGGIATNPLGEIPTAGSGPITIVANDLTLRDSEIRAVTVSDQAASDITIDLTGDLLLSDDGTGRGARINSGSDLTIEVPSGQTPIGIFRPAPTNGVTVEFDVCVGNVLCGARYRSGGDAGDIRITADDVSITGGSQIATRSEGAGDAGTIDMRLTGDLTISGRDAALEPSGLFSNANGNGDSAPAAAGNPGTISLVLPDGTLRMTDGGVIVIQNGTGSVATGTPGEISVRAAALEMSGLARIDSSTRGAGPGGNLDLEISGPATLVGGLDEETFTGLSTLSQPGSSGPAGSIDLSARGLELRDGARIAARPVGPTADGDAGNIRIAVDRDLIMRRGQITTESANAAGGNIELSVGRSADLQQASITTSVTAGAAPGGNITISRGPEILALQGSEIVARAFEGAGGNIRIETGTLLTDPNSQISASSELGIDGTVVIQSPEGEINVQQPELAAPALDVSALLDEPCSARVPAGASTFVVEPDPGPLRPDVDALPDAREDTLGAGDERASLPEIPRAFGDCRR